MKSLPRQFSPRHRRAARPAVKIGTFSAVVLSATLLASASGSGPGARPAAPLPFAAPAPAHAEDVSLIFPTKSPSASASPTPSSTPPAPASTTPPPPPPPAPPHPVAGLNQTQMNNAAAIVRQGRSQGMPEKGLIVAVATAMQESDLYNVASTAVPSSLKLPHDGVSVDHDSVGLFQQRASQGWGTVSELMDPSHSAMLFYNALGRVAGWQKMSVTAAAQAVQRSAYPSAYQKHANRATQVVAALK
ncbi:hypothetical protein [Dactylosporangium sp. CA-233914]|uniref:hypothetical protein n=1 Tax=Dactylosporangium sp. CA-233914 TaxID=3239934 RepID=UPI003D92A109